MFNYRNASIVAYSILAIILILNFFIDIGYIPYLALFLICACITFYGSASVNSNFYFKVVCSAKTEKKFIALTFDDGPSHATPFVLDVLKEYNVPAAFFVIGKRVENDKGMILRICGDGHLLGNHSYSHHLLISLFSAKKLISELRETENRIENICRKRTRLFRPPYGVTNPMMGKAVCRLEYDTVGWSLKSRDTVIKNAEKISIRLKRKIKPGDIVLFHDIDIKVVQVLKEFLEYALQNGYKIVRLDELLNLEGYK